MVIHMLNEDHWELFPHEADMGIRGIGSTLEKAFEMAAMALTATITDVDKVDAHVVKQIECTSEDYDLLFYDWLNAIIYEMDCESLLFSQFEVVIVQLSDNLWQLTGRIGGEPINIAKHEPAVEIKGATFSELNVYQKNNQWIAQCIIDI